MKALLVIDMQNACVGEHHAEFFKYDEALLGRVNEVIEGSRDQLVVYIRNLMKKNILNKFAPVQVYEGTPQAELADGLCRVSDHVFDKYAGDAFTNEKLDAFLKEHDVDEIEAIGVDGGGCVALTALGAVKKGYKVTVNTTAIGTMFEKNKEKLFNRLRAKGAVFV